MPFFTTPCCSGSRPTRESWAVSNTPAHLLSPRCAADAERLPTDACQLLNNQPRLVSGTMMNQKAHHVEHGFHGQ